MVLKPPWWDLQQERESGFVWIPPTQPLVTSVELELPPDLTPNCASGQFVNSFGHCDIVQNPAALQVFGSVGQTTGSLTRATPYAAFGGAAATVAVSVLAAPVVASAAATAAANGIGWAYGVTGGSGVVLGSYNQYPNYIDAARSIGANAYNMRPFLWDFLAATGQTWTANQSFLSTSIARGQQFYLATQPLGATGFFANELGYLTSRGVGPNTWQMIKLPLP